MVGDVNEISEKNRTVLQNIRSAGGNEPEIHDGISNGFFDDAIFHGYYAGLQPICDNDYLLEH